MASKKAKAKITKEVRKSEPEEEEESGGVSLDDALGDDDDVEYAAEKTKRAKAEVDNEEDEESDYGTVDLSPSAKPSIKQSKPIGKVKKGDVIVIDGKRLSVDAHQLFEDYKTTKEMLIELFDPLAKEDEGDYQIRYFSDQVEETLKVYILKKIVYEELPIKKIEW